MIIINSPWNKIEILGKNDNGKKIFLGDPTEIALISLGEKINIDKEKYEFKYK